MALRGAIRSTGFTAQSSWLEISEESIIFESIEIFVNKFVIVMHSYILSDFSSWQTDDCDKKRKLYCSEQEHDIKDLGKPYGSGSDE